MPELVVPITAELYLLAIVLDALTPFVHLYVNDVTPDPCSGVDQFQEADWQGYKPLPAKTWTPPVLRSHRAVSWSDPVQFLRGDIGPQRRVYGYWMTDGLSGPLIWAERAPDTPVLRMDYGGNFTTVYPQFSLQSESMPPCVYSGGVEVGGGTLPNL